MAMRLPSRTLRYGPHTDQLIDVCPAPASPRGVVALIHGGYWRAHLSRALMEPLVDLFSTNGWWTVNIEYRRGQDGQWPIPEDDVVQALTTLKDIPEMAALPVVTVGHSVGGQLALLSADHVSAAVALAPVTDTVRTHQEGLGDDAAAEYFGTGGPPDEAVLRDASVLYRNATAAPKLVVHGHDDDRVPMAHTLTYLSTAWRRGKNVTAQLHSTLDHFAAIDPNSYNWPTILAWMHQQATAG